MWPSTPDSPTPSIKRKVGYSEEEEDIGTTQSKMVDLQINCPSGSKKQIKLTPPPLDDMEMRQE
jgi:hypothetical protein